MNESSNVFLVALALPILAVAARQIAGSWLSPGPFAVLYWTVATIAPVFFSPDDPISAGAVIWISASMVPLLIGSLVGSGGASKSWRGAEKASIYRSHLSLISKLVVACTLLGAGAVAGTLYFAGYSLSVLLSLQDLVTVANGFSVGRYSQTYTSPLLVQVLLLFVYTGPLLGGFVGAIGGKRNLRIALLPLLPPLVMTAILAQRGTTIISMLFWVSSYLATQLWLGRYRLFTRQRVLVGLCVVVLTVTMAVGAGLARLGEADTSNLQDVLPKIHDGMFGHLAVFSYWFDRSGLSGDTAAFGAITLAGPADLLGVRARDLGLYTEDRVLASGDSSNIYTVFRPLLDDFTAPGSLVVLFIVGLVAGLGYRWVARGLLRGVPILAAFYATVLWSVITSVWIWNSTIGAFFMFSAVLWIVGRFASNESPERCNEPYFMPGQPHSLHVQREGAQ